MKVLTIKIPQTKLRSFEAKKLQDPSYCQRVVPNKKRDLLLKEKLNDYHIR